MRSSNFIRSFVSAESRIFARLRMPLAALLLVALGGCMMFTRPPADREFGRTRVSKNSLYRATIKPAGDSIPRGKLQSWTLHLESVDGTAIDSATVAIDGGMPQHGHGLPTKPLLTKHIGNGDHLVEGMKFNMGGWWVVNFRVSAQAGTDTVVFNLKL